MAKLLPVSSLSPSSPINKQGQSNDGGNISSLQSFKDVIVANQDTTLKILMIKIC